MDARNPETRGLTPLLIGGIRYGDRPQYQIKDHSGDKARHHRSEGRKPAQNRRIDIETLGEPADYSGEYAVVTRPPHARLHSIPRRRNGPLVKSVHSVSIS